jgi:hypothetical protein
MLIETDIKMTSEPEWVQDKQGGDLTESYSADQQAFLQNWLKFSRYVLKTCLWAKLC